MFGVELLAEVAGEQAFEGLAMPGFVALAMSASRWAAAEYSITYKPSQINASFIQQGNIFYASSCHLSNIFQACFVQVLVQKWRLKDG